MGYLFFKGSPGISYAPATVAVLPNAAAFNFTDYAASIIQDAGKVRFTRPISDGQGFEFCVPGARGRVSVTLAAPGEVKLNFQYTGLVTRTDTYNDVGATYVDGNIYGTFSCPVAHPFNGAHPVSAATTSLYLTAGTHLVEWTLPYCTSIDFTGMSLPTGATYAAPAARVARKGMFFGDSITHGFNTSKSIASWPALVAAAKSSQMLNGGYGGRGCSPADGTTWGAYGADFATYLIGFNNFYPNGGSLATFQTNIQSVLTGFRTASTTAGKGTAKLYMMTPTYSTSDVGQGGTYAGNSPTLEQFRGAIRAGITAVADPYVVLIEGASGGMPTGPSNISADGIHPTDASSITIANVVSAIVT
jgi:hypothetical protein